MNAEVCRTEPREAVIALLEVARAAGVVVVVVAGDSTRHGVTPHIGVVFGDEETELPGELKAQRAAAEAASSVLTEGQNLKIAGLRLAIRVESKGSHGAWPHGKSRCGTLRWIWRESRSAGLLRWR